jgi:hypothetical protein
MQGLSTQQQATMPMCFVPKIALSLYRLLRKGLIFFGECHERQSHRTMTPSRMDLLLMLMLIDHGRMNSPVVWYLQIQSHRIASPSMYVG